MTCLIDKLKDLLKQAEAVGLEDLHSVSLQNRIDKKYLLHEDQLVPVLKQVMDRYKVLSMGGCDVFNYSTTYFDTSDYQFYKDHHNGLGNRIKVRCREYLESNQIFFEIKQKLQGTRTDKYRKELPQMLLAPGEDELQEIRNRYQKHPVSGLAITQVNTFRRVTLVSREMKERVTVDFDISFRNSNATAFLSNLVIIEVKQGRYDEQSPMVQTLRKARVYSGSISKYSCGMLLLDRSIKYNAFKPVLLQIAKIQQNGLTGYHI